MMQTTIKPNTIFCHDNLPILRGINSDSVDLIYLDPPFNKGKQFHAPVGKTAEGAEFTDIWRQEDVKDEWHNEINDRFPKLYKYLDAVADIGSRTAKYYLIYMAVRLIEMQRILKPTGSFYLHCDPTASHYLKLLLDTIFGHKNFRNEIIWSYPASPSAAKKDFPRKHDVIFRYTKTNMFIFNSEAISVPYSEASMERIKYPANASTVMHGTEIKLKSGGKTPTTVWQDIEQAYRYRKEYTGYPTQKPTYLLERIIKASSNKNDFVLDPFCGCATTCIAAARLERQWAGIDVSKKAYDLVKGRIREEIPPDLYVPSPIYRDDVPVRTDKEYKRKFTQEDRNKKYGEQNGKCSGCGIKFDKQNLTADHIIPQSKGGGNEYINLQLLCHNCNSIKGNRPMEYLRSRLKALYS